jgi:cobalamin biosynthesis Mg chelatase CobN
MPTPPPSYSAAAAEKLRRALLALAASAATLAAHAQDAEGDLVETVTLGEIPEDVIVDGEYMCTPCPKESCPSEDCFCEDACVEGKPCTDCDTPSSAEGKPHAESAETAESDPHAESAEGAESGEGSGEAEPSPSVAPAAATNAVQELARAMSERAGYPVSADLVVAAAKRLDQDPEEYARKMLEEIGAGAASTNAPTSAPSDRILILGRLR